MPANESIGDFPIFIINTYTTFCSKYLVLILSLLFQFYRIFSYSLLPGEMKDCRDNYSYSKPTSLLLLWSLSSSLGFGLN